MSKDHRRDLPVARNWWMMLRFWFSVNPIECLTVVKQVFYGCETRV